MRSKTFWILAGVALVIFVVSSRDRQGPLRPLPATESSTVRTVPAAKTNQARRTVDYKIELDDALADIKGILVIRLTREIGEEELRRLAIRLRRDSRQHFERLFITYYLPGMRVGAGAWATTHFNPGLEVRILGR